MVERNNVEACFSEELSWINDKKVRDMVVDVWVEAGNRGKWKDINDAPFTLLFEGSGKLTEHTKRVTGLVKSIFDKQEIKKEVMKSDISERKQMLTLGIIKR